MRQSRSLALAVLALLNLFTLTAGIAVARMLPPRLARLHVPVTAAGPVLNATPVLTPVGASAARLQGTASPTARGLAALFKERLPAAATGPGVGIEVADAGTGKVLYAVNGSTPATPASTTKVVTAVAALAALGPDARFTTTVRQVGGTVVLAGGGDPTLAVNGYPSSDYPRPATLAQLAAGTARTLKAQGRHSVRLGYDTALYGGPGMAQGWTDGLISTGNVTSIVALEADQGRLTPGGALEDSDDSVNFRPRTTDPVGMTVAAFAALLAHDGVTVTGIPVEAAAPGATPAPTSGAVKDQNLQDVFLNHLRKNKIPVTMFLVKGVKLQGIVTWFDNFSILLRRDGQSQLVYKHAISTIMPGQQLSVAHFQGGGDDNGKKRLLQEVFLSSVRDAGVQVTMFLVNGVMLQGKVAAYDLFCMLLEREGYVQLAYKHAVSTIQPAGHVDLTGDWEGEAN